MKPKYLTVGCTPPLRPNSPLLYSLYNSFKTRWFRCWFGATACSGKSSLCFNRQRNSSQPGKLVPEWHQHFAGREQRTTYVRGWEDGGCPLENKPKTFTISLFRDIVVWGPVMFGCHCRDAKPGATLGDVELEIWKCIQWLNEVDLMSVEKQTGSYSQATLN